jgi:hypothetical protein
MNTIAANELKRHGITAIEKLFTKGPVHVIKRNQPVCVVLTEAEYERLTRAANGEASSGQLSVMDWFSLPPLGAAEKSELDDRLSRERDGWEAR